jgi:hypothetical protein
MIRSRWLLVLVLLAACAALSFGAAQKPAPPAKTAPKEPAGSFLGGRDLGLIVNLVDPFTLGGSGDGVQTGIGMKLWLNDRSVVRGLFDFSLQSGGGTTDMTIGLSAAYEHHFQIGKVSPYAGGILGTQMMFGTTPNLALYLGGLLGAEVRILESVAFFAEYALIFEMDEPLFTIDLGVGNNAKLGVIIYLQ